MNFRPMIPSFEMCAYGITPEGVSFGKVRLGYEHTQMIMRNDVTTVPLHDFRKLSCCFYGAYKVQNRAFRFVTHGKTSIPNFINFGPAILF
jgi:hypothetical protein